MLLEKYKAKLLARDQNFLRTLTISNNKVNLEFSTNDYLNFSTDQTIFKAGAACAQQYGAGATGSRLLSGNNSHITQLENIIAKSKNADRALVFNSGYQCNLSVLSALLSQNTFNEQPVVFFDKLNHNSLYQAVWLSGARLVRYQHCDINDLIKRIDKYKDWKNKFIVSESVFGMDGDIAPIQALSEIARANHALLYLDEAHATGIMGEHGFGFGGEIAQSHSPLVQMGTFSKALGGQGAYIACNEVIADYLVNFCSGFIYTTALSPFNVGAAYAAWQKIPHMQAIRDSLLQKSEYLRNRLNKMGFDTGLSATPIVPIIIGDTQRTKRIHQQLWYEGIRTACVLPPTVPLKKSRIRITVNAGHQMSDLDTLIARLACVA